MATGEQFLRKAEFEIWQKSIARQIAQLKMTAQVGGNTISGSAIEDPLTLSGLTLTDLTASLPVVTDGDKALASLVYTGVASFRKNLGLEIDDEPIFVNLKLTGLTDGYIPYHASDALGLDDSPLYTDGTNVGLGKVPVDNFDVAGAVNTDTHYKIDADIVLQNPGTNNLFIGVGAGVGINTGTDNVCIGDDAGNAVSDGDENIYIGTNAGLLATGNYNTVVGFEAGWALLGGGNNTIMGNWAGHSLTTGYGSVLIGISAGIDLTTGYENVIIGGGAGDNATIGYENVIIGTSAGFWVDGIYNVFIGSGAKGFGAQTTGGSNVGIGSASLNRLTTGSDCVAIGQSSGEDNTTGVGLICIGSQANVASGALNYSISLGYYAEIKASNQMVIGSTTGYINDAYLGTGVTSATPQDIAINASGGSGTNKAGAALILAGGKATGNAVGGDIVFKKSDAGVSGTTLQTISERARIDDDGFLLDTYGYAIGSNPGSGQYRVKAIRLDSSLNVVIVYESTPEP